MRRLLLYLFAFIAMLFISSCDITIGYFMIDNVPHSYHTNQSTIPAEGGEFEFYLVDYVYDESMDTKSLPTIHQCYRYRLNIDESLGAESEDCSSECITISIPENNTGKVRNLTIEVKVAEDYHNDEDGLRQFIDNDSWQEWWWFEVDKATVKDILKHCELHPHK